MQITTNLCDTCKKKVSEHKCDICGCDLCENCICRDEIYFYNMSMSTIYLCKTCLSKMDSMCNNSVRREDITKELTHWKGQLISAVKKSLMLVNLNKGQPEPDDMDEDREDEDDED